MRQTTRAPSPDGRPPFLRISLTIATAAVLLLSAAGAPAAAHNTSPTRPSVTALPVVVPRLDCAAMAGIDVSPAVGAGTGIVSAAAATASGGFPMCDLKGVIAQQIQFEVQLPTHTYRQRY